MRTLFCFLLLSSGLGAQAGGVLDFPFDFSGEPNSQLGFAVSTGDFNDDDVYEMLLGAPNAAPNGIAGAGSVFAYDGVDGSLMCRIDGEAIGDALGAAVFGRGDVDDNGCDDLFLGAPLANPLGRIDAGSVFVYLGDGGALQWRFDGEAAGDKFGCAVSAADLDDDDYFDPIVGACDASPNGVSGAGSVYAFSGELGTTLYRFDGTVVNQRFGIAVASCSDVNGDGTPDVIVGATGSDPWGIPDAGSVYVYSGFDGAQLLRLDGEDFFGHFGAAVAGAGDVNEDGCDDLLVGAPGASPGGLLGAGSAYLYSGKDGSLINQLDGDAIGQALGTTLGQAGDVDGDDTIDYFVGIPGASPFGRQEAGTLIVISGFDGIPLYRVDGVGAGDRFGHAAVGGVEPDPDQSANVLVGAPYASEPVDGRDAGRGLVIAFDPAILAFTKEVSAATGDVLLYEIDFDVEAAGYDYVFLASESGAGPSTVNGVATPLTQDALFALMLAGAYPPGLLQLGLMGSLNANGDAVATVGFLPGVLADAIGTRLQIAAVAGPPGQPFTLSTATVALDILP